MTRKIKAPSGTSSLGTIAGCIQQLNTQIANADMPNTDDRWSMHALGQALKAARQAEALILQRMQFLHQNSGEPIPEEYLEGTFAGIESVMPVPQADGPKDLGKPVGRSLVAKYDDERNPCCDEPIKIGDQIVKTDKGLWIHVGCATS